MHTGYIHTAVFIIEISGRRLRLETIIKPWLSIFVQCMKFRCFTKNFINIKLLLICTGACTWMISKLL